MRLTLGIAALLRGALVAAGRNPRDAMPQGNNIIPGTYLVEFADDHDDVSFYNSLHGSGITVAPRMNLNFSVFQGASFKITDIGREMTHASRISAMPAVKQLWPVRNYSIPQLQRKNTMANPRGSILPAEENVATQDKFPPHVMTQVDKIHAQGYNGNGIRIGIVDTGVDYRHPALGGCFGRDCLIEYGYDLVGDNWTGLNNPVPDDDPFDDCDGHGTHVSGIIAAQPNKMNFTGVAPGAKLGMYKVFSCSSYGTTDDVLIAAFNMAYEDGMDIITASIGASSGWSEEPWSVVVSRIVDLGVPCTLAAGNDGQLGLFSSSSAGDGKGVTAVASFDNIVTPWLAPRAHYVESVPGSRDDLDDLTRLMPFGWIPGLSVSFGNVSLPLRALSNDSSDPADACAPLPDDTPDLSGYVVLIRLGGCNAAKKASNAMDRNANHILFYSDDKQGLLELQVGKSTKDGFIQPKGAGCVTASQGAAWVQMLNGGSDIQLTFVEPSAADTVFVQTPNNLTGGFASYFTSWGPTWDMNVYPTIAAPGGNILSTYLLEEGGFAVDSGTSMATPFVAGVYALMAQIRKVQLNPTELANLVSSTAKANLWNDATGALRELAPVAQQGPGLIQAYDAAYTTTLLGVKNIAFNDSEHSPGPVTFTIENTGSDTITYRISHIPSIGMYVLDSTTSEIADRSPASFPNNIFTATADLHFSQNIVNLQPKHRAIITVTPSPPNDDSSLFKEYLLPIYGGYIAINGSDGANSTIPYLGLAGSLHDADNVDVGTSATLICGVENDAEDCNNITFTVPYPTVGLDPKDGNEYSEYPMAMLWLNLGTAVIRADAIALSNNYTGPTTNVYGYQSAGSIYGYPLTYQPRGEATITWNGMLADGSVVPEGKYALAVQVLRLFGDPDKEGDYAFLDPVPFTLKYSNCSAPADARRRH